MEEEKKSIEKYQAMINLLSIEAQLLSNIFTTFLIAHSIFLGCLMGHVFSSDFIGFCKWDAKVFAFCWLGLFLSICWFLAYLRGATYYSFWTLNSRSSAPTEWNLYEKEDKLRQGEEIFSTKLRFRALTIKRITIMLIISFALIYIMGIILCGFWFSNCG